MEILDVVDEGDRVTGQATRADVHARGLKHRACHMLVFNSSGQLFLQKRSMQKDNDPGLWDSSAAGHVDTGESYLACAIRELKEELGLSVTADDLTRLYKLPPIKATGMEFATIYSLISDDPLVLEPSEIDEGVWLEPDEVDQWISGQPSTLSLAFRQIWSRLQSSSSAD